MEIHSIKTNDEYIIMDRIQLGVIDIVLCKNVTNAHEWNTWLCNTPEQREKYYCWGHYFYEPLSALIDFQERIIHECGRLLWRDGPNSNLEKSREDATERLSKLSVEDISFQFFTANNVALWKIENEQSPAPTSYQDLMFTYLDEPAVYQQDHAYYKTVLSNSARLEIENMVQYLEDIPKASKQSEKASQNNILEER